MIRDSTFKDIAELSGTHPATVSRTLDDRVDVSDKLKKIVTKRSFLILTIDFLMVAKDSNSKWN